MMISVGGRVDGEVPAVFPWGWYAKRRHTRPQILKGTKSDQTKFMYQY